MRNLLGVLVSLGLVGCATNRWREYDESSFVLVMEPSDEAVLRHVELLDEWAADERDPMPPGLFIELGYWLAKLGRSSEAAAAFDKELARYPQAATYIAVLTPLIVDPGEERESGEEDANEGPAPEQRR